MSIFKKLFGITDDVKKYFENEKPDNEKLISSSNLNESIVALDNYICVFCEWGDRLDKLTEPQKNFYYNQELEREVNNGGFSQFYYNSSGNYASEIINSLKIIGADNTAEIVRYANEQFPDKIVPKDRAQRQVILEQIKNKAIAIWEKLEQEFFAYNDDLNSLNMEYIRKNRNEF